MKVFHSYIIFVLVIGFSSLLWSCEGSKKKEKVDVDTQIRMTVDEKLATRKARRLKECKEFALKEAEDMVDSMLIAQAKLTTSDTISKPPKPPKPELLDVKKAKDNTPIKPLFNEKAIEEQTKVIEKSDTKTIQQ